MKKGKSADTLDILNENHKDLKYLKSLDQTGSILLLQYKLELEAPNLHDQES